MHITGTIHVPYGNGRRVYFTGYIAFPEEFNKALGIMNRAVSGHFQPGARENVAYLTQTERRDFTPPPPPPGEVCFRG